MLQRSSGTAAREKEREIGGQREREGNYFEFSAFE